MKHVPQEQELLQSVTKYIFSLKNINIFIFTNTISSLKSLNHLQTKDEETYENWRGSWAKSTKQSQ